MTRMLTRMKKRGAMCAFALALLFAPDASATVWPSSHQRVAQMLDSGDITERRNAAARITTLPPKLARTLAAKALRDGDTEVRIHGARAAAAVGLDKAGDEVMEWLQDRDARLRLAACEVIEASPTPQSVRALARVLGDAEADVRRAAAAAMGSSGMPEAVSPLLGHLDDGSMSVRLEVVRALGRIGDERAVVPLVSKLQDQEEDVRREAARALGQLGDARAAATLMLTLQDKSLGVRVQALHALGRLRADEATPALAALLDASSPVEAPVVSAALEALGRIASAQAVQILIEALEREGPVPLGGAEPAPVRRSLVLAGEEAVDGLIATLEGSPTRRLATAAVLALAEAGSAKALPTVVKASRRGSVPLEAGLAAVGALGDRRALTFVLEQLDNPDPRVRATVVKVAGKLLRPADRDGRAVDVVAPRVRDLTTPVVERIALVRLLGRTGSPRASALLLELAGHDDPALELAVVEALGTLRVEGPEVDAVLLAALDDEDVALRSAAARAIGAVGKDDAAAKLLHRLSVAADQDRVALGIGLSGALSRSTDPALATAVDGLLASAPATVRDALIEGLGRMPVPEAGQVLAKLRRSSDPDDRRKAAEALIGHAGEQATLLAMLGDADPTVRANAAWALGRVGDGASVMRLTEAVGDLDVAVAGNVAVALAHVGKRHSVDVSATLCEALNDYRAYVRASALSGLDIVEGRCSVSLLARVLRRDSSWRVRLAAANVLQRMAVTGVSGTPPTAPAAPPGTGDGGEPVRPDGDLADTPGAVRRALSRCALEDRDAAVAERCVRPGPELPTETRDVLVYVVPDGASRPTARAPFALILPDGTMRLGVADRRGAVFVRDAPEGPLELAVPAAMAP